MTLERKAVSAIMLTLFLCGTFALAYDTRLSKSSPSTIVVPDDYPKIQEAINHANVGDTISVRSGTYYERIVVNKTLSLIGEDTDSTILNGEGGGFYPPIVSVVTNDSRIEGFTITSGGTGISLSVLSGPMDIACGNLIVNNHITQTYYGIYVEGGSSNNSISMNIIEPSGTGIELGSSNNTLFGNSITGNNAYEGIDLWGVSGNNISRNTIRNCRDGVMLYGGGAGPVENNVLEENDIADGKSGICIWGANNNSAIGNTISAMQEDGIVISAVGLSHYGYWPSSYNTVANNSVAGNRYGILILGTWDNEVVGNIIENNIYGLGLHSVDNFGEYQYSHDNKIIINSIVANTLYGIELNSSSDNLICNNNFLGNTAQVYAENSTNEWDNGYPSGGNFWGDYTDTDTQRGLYQNETGSDGIWDHPYIIDANNQDHYPFTNPWHAAPIVSLSQTPDYPLPAQKVKIYANVTESSGASGVAIVFFSYRANGGPWWNTTMVFNCDLCLYETTIPDYEKHDFVEYFVKAVDNAGNTKTTLTYHYEVLRCDANHNGVVDVYDIYMIGKVWESSVGEPRYIFDADIDENGIINEQDLCLVNLQYGKDP